MAGGPVEQYQYVQRKGSPKWIWFTLGSVGLAIAALLIFWLVSATVSESAKIDRMVSVADGIPAADWETTYSSDQKHDITCIPFDQSCHSLFRVWKAPGQVNINELVESTGYDLDIGTIYLPGCAIGWVDRVHIQLCTDGNEVDLAMYDR